jgi:Carbonic anhydrases/acetyltransferases, isoleucine patch superfamily
MSIYKLDKSQPYFVDLESCWLAPNSHIIGDVEIFPSVSVWFGVVIRGDNEKIIINKKTNIQENSILHTDKDFPLKIGEGCTIGHSSIIHGCDISSNTLIGMGSIVLNGAKIGQNSLIGAGSLIVQNQIIPEGSLVLGRPAKIIRILTIKEIKSIRNSAKGYYKKIKIYKKKFIKIN